VTVESKLFEFRHIVTVDEAVELFKVIANSPHTNGLGNVYVGLANLVKDENGLTPWNTGYLGPEWRRGCFYCGGDRVNGHGEECPMSQNGTQSGTSVAPEARDPKNTGSKPEVDQ
jgi:hypothetical protein